MVKGLGHNGGGAPFNVLVGKQKSFMGLPVNVENDKMDKLQKRLPGKVIV